MLNLLPLCYVNMQIGLVLVVPNSPDDPGSHRGKSLEFLPENGPLVLIMLSRSRQCLACLGQTCSQRLSVAWARKRQGRRLLWSQIDALSVDVTRVPLSC